MTYFSAKSGSGRTRLVAIAVIAMSTATSVFAEAPQPDTVVPGRSPQDLVDALHSAFGEHHARAVHAKGIILTGTFEPSSGARSLTKASAFAAGSYGATVRFSDFTGIPDIPDNIGEANPRGFAIKIKGSSGEDFDVVAHSFNGFPVATSDEFAAFLLSVGASGPNVPHPTPIERFLDTHPIAKAFLTSQKPPPVSYATAAYFGVNALKFTNEAGKQTHVRFRFVPVAGEHYLNPEESKSKGANYLREEITARVAKAPIAFDWFAQIAEPGDKIDDPSIAWPESRRLVKLGTIKVTTLAADPATDKQTLFLPGQSHSGMEPADPMLVLRNNAYPISFKGRQ